MQGTAQRLRCTACSPCGWSSAVLAASGRPALHTCAGCACADVQHRAPRCAAKTFEELGLSQELLQVGGWAGWQQGLMPMRQTTGLHPAAATLSAATRLPPAFLQGLYTEMKFERPSRIQVGRMHSSVVARMRPHGWATEV